MWNFTDSTCVVENNNKFKNEGFWKKNLKKKNLVMNF
jgi:hypothetical protein